MSEYIEFKDRMNDTIEVIPGPDHTVSLIVSYPSCDDEKLGGREVWLDPEVAMDVAAAIVRAVYGERR